MSEQKRHEETKIHFDPNEVIPDFINLQCSQSQAQVVRENGDFDVALYRQVIIEDGDQVNIQLSSIDTQLSDETTIIVPDKQVTSITYSYFDQDICSNKYNLAGDYGWEPTFQTFAAYSEVDIYLLAGAGIYGAFITFNPAVQYMCSLWFSWIDPSGVFHHADLNTKTGQGYYRGNVWAQHPNNTLESFDPIIYQQGSLKCIGLEIIDSTRHTWTTDIKYYYPTLNHAEYQAALPGNLFLQTNNLNIQSGRYDPSELANIMTKELSNTNGMYPYPGSNAVWACLNPMIIRLDVLPYAPIQFWSIENVPPGNKYVPGYQFKYNGGGGIYISIVLGAALISVQYGINGQVFSLAQAHTPLFNPADPNTKNIAYFSSTYGGTEPRKYHEVRSQCGIVIHQLEPVAFWQSIGLYDSVITPLQTDPSGIRFYNLKDMKICQESATVGAFCPGFNRFLTAEPLAPNPYYVDTTSLPSDGLIGTPNVPNKTGGFIKLKIRGLGNVSKHVDTTQDDADVWAIISTQYNTNSVVTGYADSGYTYVHKGSPYTVGSKLTIQFVDELNNIVPALGPNNSVFIRITKAQKANLISA